MKWLLLPLAGSVVLLGIAVIIADHFVKKVVYAAKDYHDRGELRRLEDFLKSDKTRSTLPGRKNTWLGRAYTILIGKRLFAFYDTSIFLIARSLLATSTNNGNGGAKRAYPDFESLQKAVVR